MKQALIKRFLMISLLLPFQVMIANTPVQPCEQVQAKSQFVYLSTEMRRAVECLHRMLPEHKWSPEFKDVCDRIAKDGIAAPAEQAEAVVAECLNLLDGQNCAELQEVQEAVKRYAEALRNGDATIVVVDSEMMTRACGSCNNDCNTNCNSKCIKYKKTKAFCNLFAHDLQVDGSGYIANLTSNSLRVTGNLVVDGEIINGSGTDVFDNLTVNGTFTANGTSNIGTNAVDNAINIGTNALTGRPVSIGNIIGTSSLELQAATGGLAIGTTGGVGADIFIDADQALLLDADTTLDLNVAAAGTINVGTDPVAQDVTIGNTAVGSSVTIVGNELLADGIALNAGGFVSVAPGTATAASPTATATFTPAARVGTATFTGFTTASTAAQEFVITSVGTITPTSAILVTAENAGGNDAQMTITRVEPGTDSFTVTLTNNGGAALNGDVIINFWVLS